MQKSAIVGLMFCVFALVVPGAARAFPFGGQAGVVLPCFFNSTIYALVGPPRGGEFVWTTATKTYQFGPPRYAGQWLLGLAGGSYYCVFSNSPLIIYTATPIMMMGSSGPAAPAAPPTLPPPPSPTPTPTPAPPPQGSTGKILISEVYYAVDTAHGTKPDNEWIELYNDTSATVNLSGWRVEDNSTSTPNYLPMGTAIAPGRFLIVSATTTTQGLWNIATSSFTSLGRTIGDGLSNAGDRIILKNTSGAIVDAVSWGANRTAFDPSAPVVSYSESLSRIPLSKDTNTAGDWAPRPPSPGR